MLTLQSTHVRGSEVDTTPDQDDFLIALVEYTTRKGFKTAAFMRPTDWHDFFCELRWEV